MNKLNLGIKILGAGSYVPDFCVKNDDFSKFIDTNDEWITGRTGVKERKISLSETTGYMAEKAAINALNDAKIEADKIDLIIVTTCTAEFLYPSLSCLVQRKINAVKAACFDINVACTGFISAVEIARNYLAVGEYKNILIVSSERLSNHVDFTDRSTCVLFGDGAGAVVVSAADKLFASHIGAIGDDIKLSPIYYKNSYRDTRSVFGKSGDDTETLKQGIITMDGKAVYKFAVDAMPDAVRQVLAKANADVNDIDLLIPHQANIRIIKTAAQSLGIDINKVYINIETRGNISSACIPTCIDELKKAGKLRAGMRLCFVGFGAGLTFGAIYFEY